MQASSTSPATLYPTLQATGVFGCACLLVFVSSNYSMRIGHPRHPGGSIDTGRTRFHRFENPTLTVGRGAVHTRRSRRVVAGVRAGYMLYHKFQVSRCLGAWCMDDGGRVVVLSSRCGEICLARKRKSARWVTEFLEFLWRPASRSDSGCASRSRPPGACAPSLAGARAGGAPSGRGHTHTPHRV